MKQSLPLLLAGLIAAAAYVAGSGCSKSSSSGGGGALSPSQAAAHVMGLATGAAALVRASGTLRPAMVQTVNCPGGGNMSVDLSTANPGAASINANVNVTFNSCGTDGYTFGQSWVENLQFSVAFSSGAAATLNGSVTVSSTTIQLNGAPCLVNMADNFSNLGFNVQTGAYSGSISYSGSACGNKNSGSFNP
jgi:hypothetical protein